MIDMNCIAFNKMGMFPGRDCQEFDNNVNV